eukprot:m.154168 g.154168  ORF g.154168 m.154168 type:complete len:85 (+) comp30873_c2_seq1:248-502(+)
MRIPGKQPGKQRQARSGCGCGDCGQARHIRAKATNKFNNGLLSFQFSSFFLFICKLSAAQRRTSLQAQLQIAVVVFVSDVSFVD